VNTRLHRLYGEKIIQWRNLAGRWDRQECTRVELKEAQATMEVLAALVSGKDGTKTKPDSMTIRCLELRIGIYAEEMMDLSRRHARGERVSALIKQTEASIDILGALVGGLRRYAK